MPARSRITIRVDDSVVQILDRYASRQHTSRQAVVTSALELFAESIIEHERTKESE